jgi:anaerobic magnesium-protoporphyrin IX monomethyl ester cyclase
MKVLFVYPDFLATRKKPESDHFDIESGGWYAEGLASISAVLKEAGHKTALMHLKEPISRSAFRRELEKEDPDILSFTVRTSAVPYVQQYLRWAKKIDPNLPTVLGGVHAIIAPRDTVKLEGADIVCVGEGEGPMVDLCEALEQGKSISKIKNLWVKQGRRVIKNSPRELIHPLDKLPLPDFELFDFSRLIATQTQTAVVIVSRGCPYNCGYCCNHKIRAVYPDPEHYTRFRSPKNAMLYLKKLLKLNPWISYIRFIDNILGIQKEWLEEFCLLYKKEVGLPFACDHRADLATPKILRLLKDAGCNFIYFGVETGDEELRRNVLTRPMSNEQIKRTFAECRRLGIKTLAFNILGLPHENPEKALKTIKLNAEINPDRMIPNIYTPYPYTNTYEISLKEGFIPGPIADYRDDVFLDQPNFSKEEVLFLAMHFRLLVRLYRLAGGRDRLVRLLDRVVLWPWLPRKLLTALMKVWSGFVGVSKSFVREKLPPVYIFLRDRVFSRS